MFSGQTGYRTQRAPGGQRDTFTWATLPNPTTYTPWRVVRVSDVGESAATGFLGSEWFSDGVNWRPNQGSQLLYTLGNLNIPKTTDLTTPTNLAQVKIPAGMLASVDFALVYYASYYKSGTSSTMHNHVFFGPAGDPATDAPFQQFNQNSGTSAGGDTCREIYRVDATTLRMACTANTAFSTSTRSPDAVVTVSDLGAVDQWLTMTLYLTSGSETMNLTKFDVFVES